MALFFFLDKTLEIISFGYGFCSPLSVLYAILFGCFSRKAFSDHVCSDDILGKVYINILTNFIDFSFVFLLLLYYCICRKDCDNPDIPCLIFLIILAILEKFLYFSEMIILFNTFLLDDSDSCKASSFGQLIYSYFIVILTYYFLIIVGVVWALTNANDDERKMLKKEKSRKKFNLDNLNRNDKKSILNNVKEIELENVIVNTK